MNTTEYPEKYQDLPEHIGGPMTLFEIADTLLSENKVAEFRQLLKDNPDWKPPLIVTDDGSGHSSHSWTDDTKKWMLHTAIRCLPSPQEEFELTIQGDEIDPLETAYGWLKHLGYFYDRKDLRFLGPHITGTHTKRFRLMEVYYYARPSCFYLRAGLAERGLKLAEGQWREPDRKSVV